MLPLESHIYESSVLNQTTALPGSQSYSLEPVVWKTSTSGYRTSQLRSQAEELQLLGDGKANVLRGKNGNDLINGRDGNDRLYGSGGNDQLDGEDGDDRLEGGAGDDKLEGGAGKNKLLGNAGQDTLMGGKGDEQLLGGIGNDILNGNGGKDTLTGGAGSDRFVLNAKWGTATRDRAMLISDYRDGQDSLQLVGLTVDQLKISKGTGTQAGNTVLQNKTTGEFLAILKGTHPDFPIDAGTPPTTPPANGPTETEIQSKAKTSVQSGNTTIYTGYNQVSSDNKDPWVASFTNGKLNWYRKDYEMTGDDSQGTHVLWNNSSNALYVAFTATGTQGTPQEDFRRFATDGWLKSYADYSPGGGGGGKVAILAKIDPTSGNVTDASFLTALNGTKTNSVSVKSLSFSGDNLVVQADSAFAPRRADRTAMTPTGTPSSSPNYTVVFAPDLGSVISATSTNYA